jgi:hypothetical protein
MLIAIGCFVIAAWWFDRHRECKGNGSLAFSAAPAATCPTQNDHFTVLSAAFGSDNLLHGGAASRDLGCFRSISRQQRRCVSLSYLPVPVAVVRQASAIRAT